MEQVLKNKVWSIILAILVVANIATLGGFWYLKLRPGSSAPGQQGPKATSAFIIAQLGLDATQQQAYNKLVKQHQQNVQMIQQRLKGAKDDLFNSLADTAVQPSQVEASASAIAENDKKMDMLTYQHFKQVRALCNAQQKSKFDNIIKQVLQMMAPMQQGRRPPGPTGRRGGADENYPPPGKGPPPDRQGPPPGRGPPPQ